MDKWGRKILKVVALGSAIVAGIAFNSTDAFAAEVEAKGEAEPLNTEEQQDENQESEIIQKMKDAVDVVEGDAVAEDGYLTNAEDAIANGEMNADVAEELIQNGKDVFEQAEEKNEYVKEEYKEIAAETQAAEEEFKNQAEAAGYDEYATRSEEAETNQEKIEIVSEAKTEAEKAYDDAVTERDDAFDEYSGYESQKGDLDTEKAELDEKAAEADNSVKDAKEKMESYYDNIKSVREKRDELVSKINESKKRQEEFYEILEDHSDYELVKNTYDELEASLNEVRGLIEKCQSELDSAIATLEEDKKEYYRLVELIQKLQEDCQEYEYELNNLTLEINNLKEEIAESDEVVNQLSEIQSNTGRERDTYQNVINNIRREILRYTLSGLPVPQGLYDNVNLYQKQLDDATQRYNETTAELTTEQNHNSDLKTDYNLKNETKSNLEKTLLSCERQIYQATNRLKELERKIEYDTVIAKEKEEELNYLGNILLDIQQEQAPLYTYIKEFEEARDGYENEVIIQRILTSDIIGIDMDLDEVYSNMGRAAFDLVEAEEISKKISETALLFETKYNAFIEQYEEFKNKYINAQNVVDTLLSFINGANNYIASLQNEIEAGKLVERSETALKEVKNTYLDLVKVINEYKVVAEPKPEPAPVMTDAEVQEIVEKNIWTKDPGEYTHEEVVRSLENLAALQKIQLQDPATMVFFIETYQNYRDVLKEQLADLLQAFNITFEEVEAIFMRVIFA